MIPIITLRRVRTVLDPKYVPAAAHALVTGAPIAATRADRTVTPATDMPRIWLNDHVFDDSHATFVPRDIDTLRDCCNHVLPKFNDTDCPVEFNYISIEYAPDLIHASATLHHVGESEPAGPLCFVNYAGTRSITATTRTNTTDTTLTPGDDTVLDNLIFNPESEVRYYAVDPAQLLDIATVRNSS